MIYWIVYNIIFTIHWTKDIALECCNGRKHNVYLPILLSCPWGLKYYGTVQKRRISHFKLSQHKTVI